MLSNPQMKAYIATNILGSFAFDKDGKVLEHKLFQKKPEEIAAALDRVRKGEILKQEKDIVNVVEKKGYKEIVCDRDLHISGLVCMQEKENIATEVLKSDFRRMAMDLKWVSSQAELNDLLTKVNVLLTKESLKITKSDRILMHAIGMLDELDRSLNTFSERLKEWYGLYFPEASKFIESNERMAKMVAEFGDKKSIKAGFKDKTIERFVDSSAGMEFSEYDLKTVQGIAKSFTEMFESKKRLTEYIEKTAKETIPNMSAIAGPLLASRLLAQAGGLEKMSRMPSSTVQLLGAEKALFRHLRGEGKAPKYGILFGHPNIQQAPREQKGKVARLIAAKLSLAARIDFFSKVDKSADMKKELDAQLKKMGKG